MDAITLENYGFLERFIQQETGISLGPDKQYLLESRLTPVLQDERLASLNDLCGRLRRGVPDAMRRRLAECMTTHETSFFRDPALFDALRNDLLPEIAGLRQATKTLRIWSAACSSGQEAYSLAMLLLEGPYADWKIEIEGTDLSARILERASSGRFLQIEVNADYRSAAGQILSACRPGVRSKKQAARCAFCRLRPAAEHERARPVRPGVLPECSDLFRYADAAEDSGGAARHAGAGRLSVA